MASKRVGLSTSISKKEVEAEVKEGEKSGFFFSLISSSSWSFWLEEILLRRFLKVL